jgi:hypothetical protein
MRLLKTFSIFLLTSAALAACGSGGDSGEAGAVETTATAQGASEEIACWLRGASIEEAAERPSPLGETTIQVDGQVGKICYGRPSARGRVVEGGLIPYGEPWRLGANEATAIHLPFRARVGGVELEPGSYSLYTVAGESEWEFFLNSQAERWGIPINEEVRASDVGSFTAVPETLGEPVEQLTIRWEQGDQNRGEVQVEWGTTKVSFDVTALGGGL